MNLIRRTLRLLYPVRMKFSEWTGLGKNVIKNNMHQKPNTSFYSLTATANNGEQISFESYKGKYVLIVNLASNCGFTGQYEELENLYQQMKDKLVILGFPSNDFGGQEPGTDEEIAQFCKINYGVSFPLFKKDHVKGENKQATYRWLSDASQNSWNNKEPDWNFCKYLINNEGVLTQFFTAAVSPLSANVLAALQ